MENITIHPHERVDDLQRGGLKIIQDPKRFRFGMDAVLLSGFARVRPKERVLDLCTGTGVVPLLLAEKTGAARVTGLEIQPECVEIARRSVALNGLEGRVDIRCGDLRQASRLFGAHDFEVVTVNPPYIPSGGGPRNESGPIAVSRHETLCALIDVAAAAAWVLQAGGRLYMVHRPNRLTDILTVLREHRLEPKSLRFVHSRAGAPPSLVLLEALRLGKPSLNVLPPLVVYGGDGRYTEETHDIYYN